MAPPMYTAQPMMGQPGMMGQPMGAQQMRPMNPPQQQQSFDPFGNL